MSHLKIHKYAIESAAHHHKAEMHLLKAIELVWKNKTYYQYQCRSLFDYSVKQLGLSEELASIYNKIAKKFTQVPELKTRMAQNKISVSKANRICSVLTKENAEHWLTLAEGKKRDLEKEIAKAHPEKALKESTHFRAVGETVRVQQTFSMTEKEYAEFKRAQDLMSQRLGRAATIAEVYVDSIKLNLQKNDPLKKSCPPQRAGTTKLTLTLKRRVHHNFQSQCTHVDGNGNGKRCEDRRHLDIHHVIPQSQGGTNDEGNLTILCSAHHRAHHRMHMHS